VDETTNDGCIFKSSVLVGNGGNGDDMEQDQVQVVLKRGQSFGPLISGPCGDTSEWPYICNPNIAGGKEYPYCEFETILGDIICAKGDDNGGQEQEQVEFVNVNGDPRSCWCSYFNPALGPQGVCREWLLPTDSPTSTSTSSIGIGSLAPVMATTTTTAAPTIAPTVLISEDATIKTQSDFSLSLSEPQVILISVGLSVGLMICVFLSIFYMKRRKAYEEY
jgi:hypothetical protein